MHEACATYDRKALVRALARLYPSNLLEESLILCDLKPHLGSQQIKLSSSFCRITSAGASLDVCSTSTLRACGSDWYPALDGYTVARCQADIERQHVVCHAMQQSHATYRAAAGNRPHVLNSVRCLWCLWCLLLDFYFITRLPIDEAAPCTCDGYDVLGTVRRRLHGVAV